MSDLLNNIHDNLKLIFPESTKEQLVACYDNSSVYIAMEIAEYAHRSQKQLNGKPYVLHCYDCLRLYRDFVGIKEDDYFCVDVDMMYECGLPFDGVQEVCMLHDVIEDSELRIEDVATIYEELNLKTYFNLYIRNPLLLITHDKNVDYNEYLLEVLKDPISAMVKAMDLTNNMNLLRLVRIKENDVERLFKYIKCFLEVENTYGFIEKVAVYNKKKNNTPK